MEWGTFCNILGSTVSYLNKLLHIIQIRYGRGLNSRMVLARNFQTHTKDRNLEHYPWIALKWMTQDLIDNWSTLIQVMAWYHQARSHYLTICWLRYPGHNALITDFMSTGPLTTELIQCVLGNKQWYSMKYFYTLNLKKLPISYAFKSKG